MYQRPSFRAALFLTRNPPARRDGGLPRSALALVGLHCIIRAVSEC